MKYLEKTKAQTAPQGPYNRRDIKLWFKKYGLSDPHYVVNSFRTKYCASGLTKCEECPFESSMLRGVGNASCGLLVPSCGKTIFVKERAEQDEVENLEKLARGLNDLRNRCSRLGAAGPCRDCTLKGYAGLNLCGGYRCP